MCFCSAPVVHSAVAVAGVAAVAAVAVVAVDAVVVVVDVVSELKDAIVARCCCRWSFYDPCIHLLLF